MNDRRMVVTGGSGFFGTNLIEYFSQHGWDVRNFDVSPPRNPRQARHWVQIDILNRQRLIEEARRFKPTVFLHFAARTDLNEQAGIAGYAANIEGVRNVLGALRRTPSVQRAIFASSQLVCELGYRPKDECDYRPSTLYGWSKVLTEQAVRDAEDLDITWTILRPTSLWGPWFGVPYKSFFSSIARNVYVHPAGVRTWKQWGFIGNSVYQVQRLLDAPCDQVGGKTFYLADYEAVELQQFADMVQAAVGARPIRSISLSVLRTIARLGDLGQKLGWQSPPLTSFRLRNMLTVETQDLGNLPSLIGPLPYSLQDGIAMTVSWLRDHERHFARN